MGDYDVSESESSWADARADTPTLGERTDSEDTLSNLSFDNILDNQAEVPPEVNCVGGSQDQDKEGSRDINKPQSSFGPPVPAPRKCNTQISKSNPSPEDADPVVVDGTSPEEPFDGAKVAVSASSSNTSFVSAAAGNGVRVCVTDADITMADPVNFDLPPGAEYVPTSVDFPRSPSQLKIQKGPHFMPQEDLGGVSEDESSVSSYSRAHLDLNLQNGDVRLTKKVFTSTPLTPNSKNPSSSTNIKPAFVIPSINFEDTTISDIDGDPHAGIPVSSTESSNFPSLISSTNDPSSDALDDYIEDFILPLSHESVMSRQLSFRRKVQKTLETVAAERAAQELDKFEAMLSVYDEEDERNSSSRTPSPSPHSITPDLQSNPNFIVSPPVPKPRGSQPDILKPDFNLDPTPSMFEPQSLLDIDAIVQENAPNLMSSSRKGSGAPDPGPLTLLQQNGDFESMSNYFLPQQTLDKLHAVYESSNFNNLYCLTGEIKNILSASEIEEIVANKDQLEKFIDPNVMAALSWSLNPASLPTMMMPSSGYQSEVGQIPTNESPTLLTGLKSKSSSISNGFHSDASSADDDNQSTTSNGSSSGVGHNVPSKSQIVRQKTVPVKESESSCAVGGETPGNNGNFQSPSNFQRGGQLTNSMRRKIALSKGLRSPTPNGGGGVDFKKTSEESLDDLGVGDEDWEDDVDGKDDQRSSSSSSGVFLVRRDSKRFSFKGKDGAVIDRVVEGLFVESKNPNPNGTLRRIKAPLNLTGDDDDGGDEDISLSSPEPASFGDDSSAKGQKTQRKKISVDENILSVLSTDVEDASQATDCTRSDVFHSFRNSDDDATMRTEKSGSGSTDDDEVTLDIDTPDDMEDSIMGQLESIATSPPRETVPEVVQSELESSGRGDLEDSMRWKAYRVGPADVQIDLEAIQPYRKCLSHGGYFDAEKNVAIILFSGCYLPDRSRKEYTYLMDHLFLYVLSTLEELIVEDYILVYLHGATPKSCMPTYGWLKKCYQLINHRLRKNLKGLYLVHPTFWLKTVVALTRPFVSTKFSRKVRFINTLSDLCLEIPTEHLVIPDRVLQYDFDIKVDDLKRRKLLS